MLAVAKSSSLPIMMLRPDAEALRPSRAAAVAEKKRMVMLNCIQARSEGKQSGKACYLPFSYLYHDRRAAGDKHSLNAWAKTRNCLTPSAAALRVSPPIGQGVGDKKGDGEDRRGKRGVSASGMAGEQARAWLAP